MRRVTPDLLGEIRPDEVILATGARRDMPPIPGSDHDFVFSGDDMRNLVLGQNLESIKDKTDWKTRMAMKLGALSGVTARLGALRFGSRIWMPIGKKVIIVGGELVGLELGEFLALRGREVSVIEESSRVGKGLQLSAASALSMNAAILAARSTPMSAMS
jgi:NADPH-dependent 2,4-dienoyl-CoA reductase/sulfur reductase-like enzyme